jgi:hypothetical protein
MAPLRLGPESDKTITEPTVTEYQELKHYENEEQTRRLRWIDKLGRIAVVTLTLGTILVLVSLSLLAFLWFGNTSNSLWHHIMTKNWLPEAITIISEVIKAVVGFQIGLCSAMLAALLIERSEVLLPNAATISVLRSSTMGGGSILGLFWEGRQAWKNTLLWKSTLPILVAAFALIFTFSQAITVILVSDVGVRQIPGTTSSIATAFGLEYGFGANTYGLQANISSRGTTWGRKPQFYPTFAEHAEAPYVADGVSDTGMTLRAFLPFSAATDRQGISGYSGPTTVLDARVTCQVPQLTGESVTTDDNGIITLTGSFRPSKSTPRLGNLTVGWLTQGITTTAIYNEPMPFSCQVPSDSPPSQYSSQWRIGLCQLSEGGFAVGPNGTSAISGGLISEFADPSTYPTVQSSITAQENSTTIGTAYFFLNVTLGDTTNWRAVTQMTANPPNFSSHGEWLDLVYSDASLILSVTVCYSAFQTADIPVTISSTGNRTEPFPTYNLSTTLYHFDQVRKQLGQDRSTQSNQERGILNLANQRGNWLAQQGEFPPVEPYIRRAANLWGPDILGNTGNFSGVLYSSGQVCKYNSLLLNQITYLCPDVMHTWLFQEIVQKAGSVALGLQSMITVLAGLEYYDQLAQFDRLQPVDQTYFVTTNVAKSYLGFGIVVAVIALHLLLVTVLVVMFLDQTKYSMLGNTWQAISQAVTNETKEYLAVGSAMHDDQPKRRIKADGKGLRRVGVMPIPETGQIGLVAHS